MRINFEIYHKTLLFKQPAGTSRGVYTKRPIWYVVARNEDNGNIGIGECAPLPDLSYDRGEDYEERLKAVCRETEKMMRERCEIDYDKLRDVPSMSMGIETALKHMEKGMFEMWESDFTKGKKAIPINGLVWMGTYDEMLSRIEEKRNQGFRCIKLKIGAIDFERELELIRIIRETIKRTDLEIRLDANGGFSAEDVMEKLERISKYDIHSIEQPIKAGQWEKMSEIVRKSPIKIALDEELIGINSIDKKRELLEIINPDYIVLKPTLHGGFRGAEEWIEMATKGGTGYWTTSALESNVGLNAIAQWEAQHKPTMPQGFGTGKLFTDNFEMPLRLIGDEMHYDVTYKPKTEELLSWIKK